MAQDRDYWHAILVAAKELKATLVLWTSGATKAWNRWLYGIAITSEELDAEWETQKVAIEYQCDLVQKYTREWYRTKMLAYQQGDRLIEVDNDLVYETINTDKQIIKACVLSIGIQNLQYVDDQNVIAHMAIINSNGDYEVTTLGGNHLEKIAADGTVTQDMAFLWTAITNVVVDADIYYDPDILNGSGKKHNDDTYPVVDAIEAYIDEYVNVEGYLSNQVLIEYIRQAEGVVALDLTNQKYDQAGGTSYTNVSVNFHNKRVSQYLLAGTSQLTYTT